MSWLRIYLLCVYTSRQIYPYSALCVFCQLVPDPLFLIVDTLLK